MCFSFSSLESEITSQFLPPKFPSTLWKKVLDHIYPCQVYQRCIFCFQRFAKTLSTLSLAGVAAWRGASWFTKPSWLKHAAYLKVQPIRDPCFVKPKLPNPWQWRCMCRVLCPHRQPTSKITELRLFHGNLIVFCLAHRFFCIKNPFSTITNIQFRHPKPQAPEKKSDSYVTFDISQPEIRFGRFVAYSLEIVHWAQRTWILPTPFIGI